MTFDLPTEVTTFAAFLALFVGVLLAFEGLRAWASRAENLTEARNRRMRMMRRGVSTDDVLTILRDPTLQSGGAGGPITRLRRLLVQSGLSIGLGLYALLCLAVALAAFFAATVYLPPELSAVAAILAGLVLPLLVLTALKQERTKKLEAQLPDALDLMARGLRVGHPLAVTVGSVAEDMPDPIGSEFGLIQDQVSYGDEIAVAFHDFAERAGTEDARYLSVSVGIQHSTGGNLARVLEVLAKVIRDRHTMHKKIKAISSEGRLSGVILTFLPVGIFLSIHMTTPSFYGDVWEDPLFRKLAVVMVALVVGQGLLLRRLITFKF